MAGPPSTAHRGAQAAATAQRRRGTALALLLLAAAAAIAAPPAVATVAPARSVLRRLLLPVAAVGSTPLRALAEEPLKRKTGECFGVTYPDPIVDDFTLGGAGSFTPTVPQYNPRVLRVTPGGPAETAGVRIGDEVVFVKKPGFFWVQESRLRQAGNVDKYVKDFSKDGGMEVMFRACSMRQPGEVAPEFKLPDAYGNEVSLADLREGGRSVVLFFRPGGRFFSGDTAEIKLFARAEAALRNLGASVVGVTTDKPNYQKRQADAFSVKFPLLSDPTGEVAKRYGAFLDFENMGAGATIDRKTYVIGADGRVSALFPAVGWEAGKENIAAHIGEVGQVLGGDAQELAFTALPKQTSVGDIIAMSQKR